MDVLTALLLQRAESLADGGFPLTAAAVSAMVNGLVATGQPSVDRLFHG